MDTVCKAYFWRAAKLQNPVESAVRTVLFGILFLVGSVLAVTSSSAQDNGKRGEPGQFDFYVFTLSWSPSFCAELTERNARRAARDPQCSTQRAQPYSFIAHGLWPQYDEGYPQNCVDPAPRLPRDIVSSMEDLMPDAQLIYHEWDKHGVCSGLSDEDYFNLARQAWNMVKIPPQFANGSQQTVSATDVAQAFVAANPGMTPQGIAVTCGRRTMDDVEICMTKDLQFRDCQSVAQKTCTRDGLSMPPVRRR